MPDALSEKLVDLIAEDPNISLVFREYRFVAVETFLAPGEASRSSVRVRVLPGQGVKQNIRVECSNELRYKFPLGTVFILHAKLTSRKSVGYFVYSYFKESFSTIGREDAIRLIREKAIGLRSDVDEYQYIINQPASVVMH